MIFVKVDIYVCEGARREIIFNPEAPYKLHLPKPPSTKGLKLNYQLKDDTGVRFTLTGRDARGNLTALGTGTPPTVTSSDPTIATAVFTPEGKLEITPVGPLGSTQVVVTETLDEGGTLSGELDVTIVGGAPVSFNFDSAETFPVDTTVPPVVNGGGPTA